MRPKRHAPHRARVSADFPGQFSPVGSTVWFNAQQRRKRGRVVELRAQHAIVTGDGARWKVPYQLLRVSERPTGNGLTLHDVDAMARELLARTGGALLMRGWTFGFELTGGRAGVCRYVEREINLSVSFCLKATREEISDTVLHEIAHGLAGSAARHGRIWQDVARQIGCSAERCSETRHTPGRWVGNCQCPRPWRRKRLARHLRHGARCLRCMTRIKWTLDVGAIDEQENE